MNRVRRQPSVPAAASFAFNSGPVGHVAAGTQGSEMEPMVALRHE
jgi:hypothetical protein